MRCVCDRCGRTIDEGEERWEIRMRGYDNAGGYDSKGDLRSISKENDLCKECRAGLIRYLYRISEE